MHRKLLCSLLVNACLALLSATSSAMEPLQREIQDCPNCPTMIVVQGGTFWMGEDNPESIAYPRHQVTLGDFAIGKFEVTQRQWAWLMDTEPDSQIKNCGENCPISFVNWYQTTEFAEKLSQLTGRNYRLPTEAEWEYACRSGGKDETYCGGENLDELAWYRGRNPQADVILMPVGLNKPNGLGIYDMSGNVSEWVSDWFAGYPSTPQANYEPQNQNGMKLFRGGNVSAESETCSATARQGFIPLLKGKGLGFRLVREVE